MTSKAGTQAETRRGLPVKRPKGNPPKKPARNRGRRTLHIGGDVWTYDIKNGNVVAWSPSGRRHYVAQHDLLGVSPNVVERARWKRTRGCIVTPAIVKDFISQNWLA